MKRRDFLLQIASTLVAGACGVGRSRGAPSTATATAPRRPRPTKLVQLYLGGGMDALYSLDPKSERAVDPRMKIPYKPADIVEAGAVRLAPFAAQLAPVSRRMAVINGVVGGTVSHEYGSVAIHHFGHGGAGAPTMATRLGEAIDPGAAFHEISFDRGGGEVLWQPPPGRSLYVGSEGELLRALRKTAGDLRKTETIRSALRGLANDADRDVRGIATRIEQWLGTFPATELAEVDFYASTTWRDGRTLETMRAELGEDMTKLNHALNEVLFILEHDLATCTFVSAMCTWDSHAQNDENQRNSLALAMPALAGFLGELELRRSRRTGHLLADTTAVVVCSELGRFPLENSNAGKDHFPELPVMMFGPGLRPGRYGATGTLMEASPIALATGRPDRTSRGLKPTVQDVGATLFEWFGVEPRGGAGKVLEFVLS